MSHCIRWLLLIPGAGLLAACASLPADRGLPQVAEQVAARGGPALATPDPARDAVLVETLLRQGPLDADDAVRVALLANPEVRAEYARLGLGAAEIYDAGHLANPVLTASAGFTGRAGDVNRYDLGLTQNFLDLLLLPSRTRLAQADFERTRQQAGAAVLDLDARVRGAWVRLVAARQVEQLRRTIAEAAATSAELAQRYFDAGNIAMLDLELEQALSAQAVSTLAAAQQDRAAAQAELGQLLGLAGSREDWQVRDGLPPVPATDENQAGLLDLAERSRLDLAARQREVSAQEDALGVARRTHHLGQFDLGVHAERDTDGAHLAGPSMAIELPLFNPGDGRVLQAQAQLERSRAELDTLVLQIGHAVRAAHTRLATAQALAARYRDITLPLQQRIVEHMQQRVNAMLAGPFELIRARQQAYDADQRYIEAVRDYWIARFELERAVGARLPLPDAEPPDPGAR